LEAALVDGRSSGGRRNERTATREGFTMELTTEELAELEEIAERSEAAAEALRAAVVE